jgi:hypothetical protein
MIDRRKKKPMTAAERQRARRQRLAERKIEQAAVSSPALWLATVKKANDALALMLYVMRRHGVSIAALRALIKQLAAIEADAHRAMWRSEPP